MRFIEIEEQLTLRQGPPYENTEKVAALQKKLGELGYSVGSTGVDGKYGHRTSAAVRAFKRDFNITTGPRTVSSSELQKLMGATPVDKPSTTGNEIGGGDQVSFASGEGEGRVRMANTGTRNQPIQRALMDILKSAAETAGVDVVVTSGGQDYKGRGGRRTGSTRHDGGYAADLNLRSDGRVLRTDREDPVVAKFIAAAVDAGAKGIGAGPGYMGGTGIHVDLHGSSKGAATWGRGGRTANTPDYVRMAYRTGQTGAIG